MGRLRRRGATKPLTLVSKWPGHYCVYTYTPLNRFHVVKCGKHAGSFSIKRKKHK